VTFHHCVPPEQKKHRERQPLPRCRDGRRNSLLRSRSSILQKPIKPGSPPTSHSLYPQYFYITCAPATTLSNNFYHLAPSLSHNQTMASRNDRRLHLPLVTLKRTAATSSPFLKAPREIQILHHEFDHLKQITKDQIIFVYDRTMGPNTPPERRTLDSHSRICQALRFLGVEYSKNSLTTPDDLLAEYVDECNKLLFDWYEIDPSSTKSLKEQACRHLWGLNELKAITARWMQRNDEDELLERVRKLMKIEDEARSKYQTSFNGYNTLQQATKGFTAEKDVTEVVEEEEVIREEFIRKEVRCNTRNKMKLDGKTLKMIKDIKEAHDALTRRTTRLLAHLVDVSDFTDCPKLPLNRRLKAPEPVDYPWINKEKRRRQ
jgi:hypothetical protein